MANQKCSCSCGHVAFDIVSPPLFRLLCHCTICQRFNDAPYGDILVYDAKSVGQTEPGTVNFDTYKPPPNVQRGKCAKCNKPAIEYFHAPLFPKLTMVPALVHCTEATLPSPVAHVFYDKRIADADDTKPKHAGFMPSQLAFGKYLLQAKLFRK